MALKKEVDRLLQKARDTALSIGLGWVDSMLSHYQEPEKKRVLKGQIIGFSKQKQKATLLSILYPYCLDLREIAKKAKISEGVLRVWRTQTDFKDAIKEACESFSEEIWDFIVEKVENKKPSGLFRLEIEGLGSHPHHRLMELLPFFHQQIALFITDFFIKNQEKWKREKSIDLIFLFEYGNLMAKSARVFF